MAPKNRTARSWSELVIAAAAMAAFTVARPASAAVVAHYSFDSNFTDSSGNGNNGTATDGNGDSLTTGVSIDHTAGESVFGGGAANFTGTDYVAIPSHTFGSGSAYSISFWARDLDTTASSGGMVIGQSGTTGYFIWLDSSISGLRWRSTDSTTARNANFSFTNDTSFHQYAIVASGSTVTLYRDGTLFGTATGKMTGFIANAIGDAYTGTSLNFDGQIDEVWIFNQSLTASQVHNLYVGNSIDAITVPAPAALPAGLTALGLMATRRRSTKPTTNRRA